MLLTASAAFPQVSFTVSSFTPDIYGLGTATLTWSAPNASTIQIHVNSASGPELTQAGNAGSVVASEWVDDGMMFYLQDVTFGPPGVTIATVTAHAGPPAILVGTPNPFTPNGQGLGLITLVWSAGQDVTATEIHINSTTGPELAASAGSGNAVTGEWVNNGMQFYLQNVTYGRPGSTLRVFTANETYSHYVFLSWNASVSSDVVGYNVYRGSTSGGPYTIVNSSLVAATTFTDSTVLAGQTYYYVCTAVDNNSNQSTYSDEAIATVPSP